MRSRRPGRSRRSANIVRLRYNDAPVFLDVSSLISQYQLEGAVNANGTVFPGVGSNSVTMGAAGRYIDRPTVTYTPVQGEKFTKSMLRADPAGVVCSSSSRRGTRSTSCSN